MKATPFLLALVLLLAACTFPTATPTALPAPTISWTVYPTLDTTPTFTPTASLVPSAAPTRPTIATSASSTHEPGLLVRGRVTFEGAGLAGVSIYRSYASYPGELIAVTDANGYYQSEFMGIPGDEMVTITAELSGYLFDPPYIYWRHYHSYEETTCDFAAMPTP